MGLKFRFARQTWVRSSICHVRSCSKFVIIGFDSMLVTILCPCGWSGPWIFFFSKLTWFHFLCFFLFFFQIWWNNLFSRGWQLYHWSIWYLHSYKFSLVDHWRHLYLFWYDQHPRIFKKIQNSTWNQWTCGSQKIQKFALHGFLQPNHNLFSLNTPRN